MLQLSKTYTDRDILSLQTGSQIGKTTKIIMNPNNLQIEGWLASNYLQRGTFVLPTIEIREFIPKGVVVNDHHALTPTDDLVRMQESIKIGFELFGKPVITERKHRLGKIHDFAVDEDFYVQKLYVSPSLLRTLSTEQKLIDRSDIVEITDKYIIVKEAVVRAGSPSPAAA